MGKPVFSIEHEPATDMHPQYWWLLINGARVVGCHSEREAEQPQDTAEYVLELALAGREHCPTCICGRRAPVQADGGVPSKRVHGPGTIAWEEYLRAWSRYAARYGSDQSAERMVERGGFGWDELCEFLGYEPKTWEPR